MLVSGGRFRLCIAKVIQLLNSLQSFERKIYDDLSQMEETLPCIYMYATIIVGMLKHYYVGK